MELIELLKYTRNNRASDLHLSPDQPPTVRVDGDIKPLRVPELTPEQVKDLIYSSIRADNLAPIYEAYLYQAALQQPGGDRASPPPDDIVEVDQRGAAVADHPSLRQGGCADRTLRQRSIRPRGRAVSLGLRARHHRGDLPRPARLGERARQLREARGHGRHSGLDRPPRDSR